MVKYKNILRFRTEWLKGDPPAIVGLVADIPLNTPIIFEKNKNGRYGWKIYKKKEKKVEIWGEQAAGYEERRKQ